MPEQTEGPTPFRDLYEFLGLNYRAPESGIDCLKEVGNFPGHVRGAVDRLMNL